MDIASGIINQFIGEATLSLLHLAMEIHPRNFQWEVIERGAMVDAFVALKVGFLSFQHRSDGCGLDFDHANITGNVHDMAGAAWGLSRDETDET